MFSRVQQVFALFSLFLFLQAVLPSAIFSEDVATAKSQSVGQKADPMAEEDENSDVNLKFFCEEQDFLLDISHYSLPVGSDLIPAGHIIEIPTPPPLA